MKLSKAWPRLLLALIVLVYVLVAVQYARLTPPWQAPDEPAHFNYARYLAENGALPVLQPGDYPHEYLEQLKAQRFPPEMAIDTIRYEAWQPPAYYCLAAAVYRLAGPQPLARQLLALRLLSVALGALLLVLTYRIAHVLAPGREWLALGGAALVAAIPMHIAMTAAVNNDALAEVCTALLLWQLLGLLRRPEAQLSRWMLLGATVGFAALTKLSTLTALPLVLAVALYTAGRSTAPGGRLRALAGRLLACGLPAVLLLSPWLVRNMRVYGAADPFAFARHGQVVIGQPRTADWIGEYGVWYTLKALAVTTFQSFWGQFGWMGVPLEPRLYRGLAALVAPTSLGLALRCFALRAEWSHLPAEQRGGILLCAGSTLLSLASLIWYNLSFVQHQGRYLYPALIPIAMALVVGWREISRRGHWLLAAATALLAAGLFVGYDTLRSLPWDKRLTAALVGLAGTFGLNSTLPERWPCWLYVLPYPAFLALDLVCLYGYIVPALS